MSTESSLHTSLDTVMSQPSRRVTDAATRMFHWLFALSFVGAYATADGERWREIHMMLGYLMIGLLAGRLVWGIVGPKRVRFAPLFARIAAFKPWFERIKSGQPLWQASWNTPQNALMATLICLMLVTTVPLVFSGYATNADIAGELMEEVHELLGEFYLFLALAHLTAIGLISIIRRRNLANPMLTGYLNEKGPDLVKHNYTWLAVSFVVASLAWCAYYLNL